MLKLKQKGGSVASDAVTSLVSQDTYAQMNKTFTNQFGDKQCGGKKCKRCMSCGQKLKSRKPKSGGSLGDLFKPVTNTAKSIGNSVKSMSSTVTNSASSALGLKSTYTDSVFSSQPAAAYNSVLPRNVGLNSTKLVKAENAKVALPPKAKFTNSATVNASIKDAVEHNVAVQNAAQKNVAVNASMQNAAAQNSTVTPPPAVGGKHKKSKKKVQQKKKSSKKLTGGNLKPMSELMARDEQGMYSIRNKRGGAQVGLDYSSIKTSGSVNGPEMDRAMDPTVLKITSTQPLNTFPLLQKTANWGSPLDEGMGFKYSGDRISIPPPSSSITGGSMKKAVKKAAKKLKMKKNKKTSQ